MNNFIKDIEISNFKSIRHQKIEGCKRINVFIGYPNVGKSNILEALSMLSYTQKADAKITQLCRIQDFSELYFDGNINEPVSIKISSQDTVSLKFESNYSLLFEQSVKLKNDSAGRIRTLKKLRFPIDSTPISNIEDTSIAEMLIKTSDLKQVVVKKYQYKSSIEKDVSGYPSLFFPDGQNLFYTVERNPQLRKDVVDLLSFYGLKLLFDKGNKYSMKAMKTLNDETVFSIPFFQIADTLQRLIFYKAAIQTNTDSVLIFEEPEAHMFPPYISKFTSEIWDNDSNQYFLATHSPFVLNDFMENAKEDLAIYVVDYKNGETIVKRLSDEDVHQAYQFGMDLFFNLESYLG